MLSHLQARPARILLAFLVAAALTLTAAAPRAFAAPAPNESVIAIDPILSLGLTAAGAKITPKGAAKGGSAGIYYPVTGSSASTAFVGTVKHNGGFELAYGNLRVGAKNFTIKTANRKPVSGVLNAEPTINGRGLGFQVPFSTLTTTSVSVRSGLIIAKYKLAIDPRIANLINGQLGLTLLKPGDPWGTGETRLPAPATSAAKSANR